jgi:hypothetical protein
LLRAATVENKRFKVIVLEGWPDSGGAKSARALSELRELACRLFDLRYVVWIRLLIPMMYVSSRRSVQFQFRTRLRFASIAETGGGSGSV